MMTATTSALDAYMLPLQRKWIEDRFYAKVNDQARFEALLADESFWAPQSKHVGLFSDHGVVHVQDVALQVLRVMETVPGLLVASRCVPRLEWMKAYGVVLAYLHDIGMSDFSAFGRVMHAEFAGQAVFMPELDDWVRQTWRGLGGGFAARLEDLENSGVFSSPLDTVARELFSLALAHSKSKVPISLLNDLTTLRTYLLATLSAPLSDQYQAQRPGSSPTDIPQLPSPPLSHYYTDFQEQAFCWLLAERPDAQEFVHDVIDAVRIVRCADALRQRGTVQKTSGGYEVFLNRQTGHPVYALRDGDHHLYLLEHTNAISGGEANTASSELNRDGNLRISFQLGAFDNEAAMATAAHSAAYIVNDIQGDVIESFQWPEFFPPRCGAPLRNAPDIQILLENTSDRPDFVHQVVAKLHEINPDLANPIHVVPSLSNASPLEVARYLAAPELDWEIDRRQAVLDRVAETGHQTSMIDPVTGFRHARESHVRAGETLIEAHAPSGFVYIPLAEGLRVFPLGGYQSFSVQAWMPLGITGVIRGATRNADVRAERDVPILILPQEIFMEYWHRTFSLSDLAQWLGKRQ